ncbi:MAG TPA: formate dehydrogenase subunit alpha [Candidatus Lambdaproteobacteria bacterium]|nr:formate dehydrogenase subunit alpha [Candidatus Lambdaproteobacteria bacterium]
METISFELNGQTLDALAGETILQAADRAGVANIPRLCYKEGYRSDGNCRSCMVEIEGERVLAPSCCRYPQQGMKVNSKSERAIHSQKMVLELLLADMPDSGKSPYTPNSELDDWVEKLGLGNPRFSRRIQPVFDNSHPAMSVNLDACIQCTRCVRACREVQVNDVIGMAYRGSHVEIVFDFGDPMGDSTCVACGECVQACPTGALMPANDVGLVEADKKVDSVCPYCGVGCLLTYHVKEGKLLRVDGREGPANHERMCVKGRYGFDYVHHQDRLKKPLIRLKDVPKTTELLQPKDWKKVFREASWEEALDFAANGFSKIRDKNGPDALAAFGCAKGSNEEAYLLQKLVRTGFGTNNIDHCTRLCHASSVNALLEGIGSGAVSNPFTDVTDADVIFLIGANPIGNHPVAATFMKNAVKAGKKLILLDPRRTELSRHATYNLQFRPDTDVALLNSLMHVIIKEGLCNEKYIAKHTTDFEKLKANVADYSPEKVAPICGIPAETLREVARTFATAEASIILWGMGISQHIHGTDNSRCLIALSLMTGQIGRPGTGLHPLRGQNNVQGTSDMGLIPMFFPDYKSVVNPEIKKWFEEFWGTSLNPKTGLTVVEIVDAVHSGEVHGMYVQGENPAMSDPNLNHARGALTMLDHLVVQDIFLTETAGFADVILPASAFPEKTGTFTNSNRQVQLGRQAINPPGDSRQDWWIIQEIGRRLGLDWNYESPQEIFTEVRKATPSMAGITWERLQKEHTVTYPCTKEGDPGDPIIFQNGFPTENKKARFVPAKYTHADEMPDEDFPFVFITSRQLEHWHTGSMTRRATVLNAIERFPVVQVHPDDLKKLGVEAGDAVTIESRRGKISTYARKDPGVQQGNLFMAFGYNESAANLITTSALDPFGKIPEVKFCAVRISAGGTPEIRIG